MISNRILMTCSHNVYSEYLGKNATSLEFVAGIEGGHISQGFYHSK